MTNNAGEVTMMGGDFRIATPKLPQDFRIPLPSPFGQMQRMFGQISYPARSKAISGLPNPAPAKHRSRAGSPAFTLVELLVVIGVIAVLAAVLAPVVVDARKSALRSTCKSNLAQISRAFELYLADYSGCYPNTDNQYLWAGFYWRDALRKYVGVGTAESRNMVLSCPSDPTPPGIYSGTSYAYSACFYMTPEQVDAVADGNHLRSKFAATNPKLPCAAIKASRAKHASRKVLIAEYWTLHSQSNKVGWYDDLATTDNDPWSGERNYMFADGHVTFMPTKRIRPARSPLVERPRLLPDINLTTNGVAGKDVD